MGRSYLLKVLSNCFHNLGNKDTSFNFPSLFFGNFTNARPAILPSTEQELNTVYICSLICTLFLSSLITFLISYIKRWIPSSASFSQARMSLLGQISWAKMRAMRSTKTICLIIRKEILYQQHLNTNINPTIQSYNPIHHINNQFYTPSPNLILASSLSPTKPSNVAYISWFLNIEHLPCILKMTSTAPISSTLNIFLMFATILLSLLYALP